jgi:hypothetical protein
VLTSLLTWTTSESNMLIDGIEVTAGAVLVPSVATNSGASGSLV